MASPATAGAPGQGFLPDNRAWEMVSPPDKNGNDVLIDTGRLRVSATDGQLPMAAMFASFGSFADVVGGGNAVDYLSQRTLRPGTPGWTTHSIYPRQNPMGIFASLFGAEGLYVGDPTSELTQGVFRSFSSLPETQEEVAETGNLYMRTDLRDPGAGAYQLLTGCTFGCVVPASEFARSVFVASSADGREAVFESSDAHTADAPESGQGLYKTTDGTVRFAGYIPPSGETVCTGVEPACVAIADAGAGARSGERGYNPLSSDGNRIFFTTAPENLYMRDDRGTATEGDDITIQVNVSERSSPASPEAATFWAANVAGNRAFFTSFQALTDDAPLEGGRKLYRWSLTPDGDGHRLAYISVDDEPADPLGSVRGVIGSSEDGSSVYFIQDGQIVSGAPQLDSTTGIYLWRQAGGVRYVGSMADHIDADAVLPTTSQPMARVTPDGAHLLIGLRQPPAEGGPDHGECPGNGGATSGCWELYLYDAPADGMRCVSCRSGGLSTGSDSLAVRSVIGSAATSTHRNRAISDDGRYVFFSSPERLAADDVNGQFDAYVYDSATDSVRLLSSGSSPSPSYFVDSSAAGGDAFIVTRERLSAWDVDTNVDLYDARIGGGVPEPAPVPSLCRGEVCQGLPEAPAELLPAAPGEPRRAPRTACRGKASSGPRRGKKRPCPKGKRGRPSRDHKGKR